MNSNKHPQTTDRVETSPPDVDEILLTAADEAPPDDVLVLTAADEVTDDASPVARSLGPRRIRLPVLLFVATCLSTLLAGSEFRMEGWAIEFDLMSGLAYSAALMTILVCHEAGHYLQARRYGVYASLPYFLPMPFSPFGTFGAVIGMDTRVRHRKALFDIGVTGPLAGLVPTLVCCVIGLRLSTVAATVAPNEPVLGTSFLFSTLAGWLVGPESGALIKLHPLAFAGWVGLLITALNLLPIGQLDGGHILYGLLGSRARFVAAAILIAAIWVTIRLWLFWWWLMLFLLILMGPGHPPTSNDREPVGWIRVILGLLALALVPLAFTPQPILLF